MSKLVIDSTASGTGERAQPKTGLQQAILVTIADIGTQPNEMYGPKRQVVLTWELPNQVHTFDEEKGPEPLHTTNTFTLSLHEKSGLRKAVRGMLGEDITGEFDLMSLLGKNCMVNLVEVVKGDKTYVNIDSISPLMEGLPEKQGVKLNSFSIGDFERDDFLNLHQWIKDKITAAPEFDALAENPFMETDQ